MNRPPDLMHHGVPMHLCRFALGRIVATPGVLDAVPVEELLGALRRHVTCDFGDVSESDRRASEHAVINADDYILSVYPTADYSARFYVVTEHDRSVTTLCLPEER
jgi:hypothetical protein